MLSRARGYLPGITCQEFPSNKPPRTLVMVKSKVCQITNCEAIVPPRTATAINWYCFDDRVFFFLHFSATLHLPRATRAARLLVRVFWIKVWEDVSCFPISHRRSFPVAITCKAEAPLTADHHLCESFTRPVTIGWLSVVYVSNSVTVMRARDQPLPCRTTGSPGPQGGAQFPHPSHPSKMRLVSIACL